MHEAVRQWFLALTKIRRRGAVLMLMTSIVVHNVGFVLYGAMNFQFDAEILEEFGDQLMVEHYLSVREKGSNDVVIIRFKPDDAAWIDDKYWAATTNSFAFVFDGVNTGNSIAMQEGMDRCVIDYPNARPFHRMIPQFDHGGILPPSVYEIVARLRLRDKPDTILSEARHKFYVPQVIKGEFTPGAINVLNHAARNQVIDGVDTVIVQPIPDVPAFIEAIQKKIEWYFSSEALGGAPANVIFVWDDRPIRGDYKVLRFRGQWGTEFTINPLYGDSPMNDRNKYPGVHPGGNNYVYVNVHHIMSRMQEETTLITNETWKTITDSFRPYAPNDVSHFIVRTAVHEVGHALGLVRQEQLSTATGRGDWHYRHGEAYRGYIMHQDEFWTERFGRSGDAKWTEFDKAFLRFVLPRPNHNP